MKPGKVAGYVMISALHNDLTMYGPYGRDGSEAVRLFLKNGYGLSLTNGWYETDDYPEAAVIKAESREHMERDDYTYPAVSYSGEMAEIRDGERGCDVNRAIEILTHLKGL